MGRRFAERHRARNGLRRDADNLSNSGYTRNQCRADAARTGSYNTETYAQPMEAMVARPQDRLHARPFTRPWPAVCPRPAAPRALGPSDSGRLARRGRAGLSSRTRLLRVVLGSAAAGVWPGARHPRGGPRLLHQPSRQVSAGPGSGPCCCAATSCAGRAAGRASPSSRPFTRC